MQSVLQIPLQHLIDSRIDMKGLYENCTMLFRQFLAHYDTKVFLRKLEPIENLTTGEKGELWHQAGEITQIRDERVKVVKVIYFIDFMISKKYKL